jgi:hypothetical protein
VLPGIHALTVLACLLDGLLLRAQACARFKVQGQPYKPRVTFVTVQKRHNTRLFPGDQVWSATETLCAG